VADRTVSLRRLGEKESRVLGLDAVVAALAAEATPPDLRRPHGGLAGAGLTEG
jgi:threonyl-tRNA synthetase